MAREAERAVIELLRSALRPTRELPTPDWLLRPGRMECARTWPLMGRIYRALGGSNLPETMPARERRTIDAVFRLADGDRLIEFDETQHFNAHRGATLRCYPDDLDLAFDKEAWLTVADAKTRLEGGGFAKPRPPLFPEEGGRHRQRAFRDALCDILPSEHGFRPTLRIGYFEVAGWLHLPDALARMRHLLESKRVI